MKRLVLIIGLTIGWSLLNIIDHKNRWIDKFAIVRAQSCCIVDEPTCIANNGTWDPVTCCTYGGGDPDPTPTPTPDPDPDCSGTHEECDYYTYDGAPFCDGGYYCTPSQDCASCVVLDSCGHIIDAYTACGSEGFTCEWNPSLCDC